MNAIFHFSIDWFAHIQSPVPSSRAPLAHCEHVIAQNQTTHVLSCARVFAHGNIQIKQIIVITSHATVVICVEVGYRMIYLKRARHLLTLQLNNDS